MATHVADLNRFYRTGEVALQLGISPARVRQLVAAGKLDATYTPFGYLFEPQVVIQFQRDREVKKKGVTHASR